VLGLACERSEVSGRRLWGLMQARFGEPETFFRDHWVANYCPLVFMEQGGRNRTPDKLPADERDPLAALCDQHLEATLAALGPAHVVGVGQFAQQKMLQLLPRLGSDLAGQMKVSRVLHPSPASPAANRGWAEQATRQLVEAGVWPSP
jgi:single-strand selective monofunctional uracil DNA glycosylase